MQLGEVAHPVERESSKPLEGVRVLAAEQMQSLPFGTQLLARLGADVVKVEHTVHGESGRGALPAATDPEGRRLGATFLRNNLNKRSVGIDVKHERGRELFLALAPHFYVLAENVMGGTMARLGLGYDDVARVHPSVVYVSVSGFGNLVQSPYDGWLASAPIAEAMSGLYDYKQLPGRPPTIGPAGALGDTSSALFATIGLLAALRHRDRPGEGQYVDVAMFDSMVAMADLVTNYWSMGMRPGGPGPAVITAGFQAADGWFGMRGSRDHQFERLAALVGHPEWVGDPRFATRAGWRDHLDDVIRPAVERWAGDRAKLAVCHALNAAGVAAGPCNTAPDVIGDPHVAAHNMLVETPRSDDAAEPVLVPGNPIKLSRTAEGPETRVPWVGEHTDEVLGTELGLDGAELEELRRAGVIA